GGSFLNHAWLRRTNVWRRITNPARAAKRLRLVESPRTGWLFRLLGLHQPGRGHRLVRSQAGRQPAQPIKGKAPKLFRVFEIGSRGHACESGLANVWNRKTLSQDDCAD